MSTLGELLAAHTMLPGGAVDHLHAVVGEWQLLADLSFGDYLMWVRRDDDRWVCVAQCRPNTAATLLITDAVGTVAGPDVLSAAVPVRYRGEVVAVLTRQSAGVGWRASSPLEQAYLDCADHLLDMVASGTFPDSGDRAGTRSSPRVGDGFIRLHPDGTVAYASPNALSAYHRMGLAADLEGHTLVDITRPLLSDPFEAEELVAHVGDALAGGPSARLEIDAGGATVLVRTLPLVTDGTPAGAAVLIRDVTEVKRRDRALLSKDATIREIHHRVKNNLQTVAALLRLQARRTNNDEAREALAESVRRVAAIAKVHEALSMSVDEEVDLDEVIDRILPMMNDVARVDTPIRITREGTLGVLDAARATALVMVVTELVQNAIQHAFAPGERGGCVAIRAERSARWLDVLISDDGCGLPEDFSLGDSEQLGLQIAQTLVSNELDGCLQMTPRAGGGTDVVLRVPVGRRAAGAAREATPDNGAR